MSINKLGAPHQPNTVKQPKTVEENKSGSFHEYSVNTTTTAKIDFDKAKEKMAKLLEDDFSMSGVTVEMKSILNRVNRHANVKEIKGYYASPGHLDMPSKLRQQIQQYTRRLCYSEVLRTMAHHGTLSTEREFEIAHDAVRDAYLAAGLTK